MKIVTCFLFINQVLTCMGQPNCNMFKWKGDSLCYHACLEATKAIEFEQGSKESQLHFDIAIELCPTLDYAYYEKAVPYLKRGEFNIWKKLIDKAVDLNPTEHLGYRGWCRYQFLRDYTGAIEDFQMLETILPYNLGYSVNGDYHLLVAKALCYEGLGNYAKAISIIETQLSSEKYHPLPYDYFHVGVLKLKSGDYHGAITALMKEIEINDYLADTYFYLAICYKKLLLKKEYASCLQKAKEFYLQGKRRVDDYTEPMDKVYLTDIDQELINGW